MPHVDVLVVESWYEGNDREVAQQLGARVSPGEPTAPPGSAGSP
jgi:hypothetical protein